ncbi:MAG: DUF3857 domain-containing protein [Burkholderiales bacterium]|nr:DUF3857 domain-containing protein [Burkholderiales bacterium]
MLLLCVGLGLPGLAAALPQASRPQNLSFAPAPAWVDAQAVPLDAVAPAEGLSQGQHYLLADEQVRVVGTTQTDYHHVAVRAVNERGVEEAANVQIRFDPSYQTLTIHRIEVRRAGKTVFSVPAGSVKLLQREASLESLVFDGRLTAHVALQDVRVGDVVETVYSRQGHNPVFGDHQFGSFDLEWGVPLARLHARLLWPRGRPLHWKLHNAAPAARVTEAGGELDHRWQQRDVAARTVDSGSPGWYDPYNWVEWGEFEDWAAVAHWALPLYRLPDGATPAVDREAARIAAQTTDPEQRLLAALRFVQGQVRYLGIEMGVNSHAPHAPELVLQRRFGDCKDKTLLSLALLRRLGIPARAALVHTGLRQAAAERLPTPWAFNHVLVQADLGDRRVWLDPTRTPQAGKGLDQWVQADFGRALLVDAGTRELVPMAGLQARALKREVRAVLDASAGFDQPAMLTVTTHAWGESAEQLRDALATTARNDLQKQYLDFYAASYPGLAVDQPYTVNDDRDANTVEFVEHYRMPSYWKRDDKRARWTGDLEVPDLLEWLRSPQRVNRQSPLALRHPVDFTLISEFRLPGKWDVKPDPLAIDDPAFELHRDETWKGSVLLLTDHYLSRSNHVAAADMARYAEHLDKARTGVNYNLYHADAAAPEPAPAPGADSPHWLPLTVGLVSLGGLALLLRRLYRWDPAPVPLPPGGGVAATALGGWLWLPILGLIATPFRIGKVLMESVPAMTVQGWTLLSRPGSATYHPLLAPVMLAELVLNLAIAGGAVLLLWLMARRRSSLPRLYIGWWLLVFVALVFDAITYYVIPSLQAQWTGKEIGESVRTALSGVIWVSYFLRSDRVRRTFVNRRHPAVMAPPEAATERPADRPADTVAGAAEAGPQSAASTPV